LTLLSGFFTGQEAPSIQANTGHVSPFYYANTLAFSEEQSYNWDHTLTGTMSVPAPFTNSNDDLGLASLQENNFQAFNPDLEQQNYFPCSLPVVDQVPEFQSNAPTTDGMYGGQTYGFHTASGSSTMPTSQQDSQIDIYSPGNQLPMLESSIHPTMYQMSPPTNMELGSSAWLSPHESVPSLAEDTSSQLFPMTFEDNGELISMNAGHPNVNMESLATTGVISTMHSEFPSSTNQYATEETGRHSKAPETTDSLIGNNFSLVAMPSFYISIVPESNRLTGLPPTRISIFG